MGAILSATFFTSSPPHFRNIKFPIVSVLVSKVHRYQSIIKQIRHGGAESGGGNHDEAPYAPLHRDHAPLQDC